jgi:hypothetical protein
MRNHDMNVTAIQPSAKKYRFAALGLLLNYSCLNPAKRCFVASALISRVFQHMVLKRRR